ncbi:MAG: DUF5522 domain-containing protein [Acidimicrobiales bacterium]
MEQRSDPLADRPLTRPAQSRLRLDTPDRAAILAAHEAALLSGAPGYTDPVSGLFVFSAGYLAARGYCCSQGCRHCPYVEDD